MRRYGRTRLERASRDTLATVANVTRPRSSRFVRIRSRLARLRFFRPYRFSPPVDFRPPTSVFRRRKLIFGP